MASKILTEIFLAEKDKGRKVPDTNRFKSDADEKKKEKDRKPSKGEKPKDKKSAPAPKEKPQAAPAKAAPEDDFQGRDGDSEDFPDFGAPQSATQDLGYDTDSDLGDEDQDYKSPFGALGLGSGGSSWDNVPDWMRDPDKVPRVGGGSNPIKGRYTDPSAPPAPAPKQKGLAGLSPVGQPWQQKQVNKATGYKKPGLLGRIFGMGKKKGPNWATDTVKGDHEQ